MTLLLALLLAQGQPVIDLRGARVQAYPMAVAPPLGAQDVGAPVEQVIDSDFERSGLFKLLDPKSFLAPAGEPLDTPAYAQWQTVGAQGLVKISCQAAAEVRCEFRLFDVARGQPLLHGAYAAPRGGLRAVGHRIAGEVVKYFTREPAVFDTRLAWVRETDLGKQIMVSDWDGANATALTGASINLLPAWTPDGKALAFTSFRDGSGAHIYSVDAASKQLKPLVTMGDFASGAVYAPDGSRFLFSASLEDNTDLYAAAPDGSGAHRLTTARGIDTSPTWSPDGRRIAFVSDRAGSPQIFVMNADGSAVQRLTFQGNYNQEPAWSPRGDLIAFSGRDEHRVFDIYTVDVASGKVARLTQNAGTNEKPSWAPNGRYLVFSSTRSGKRQLWMMQPDGSNAHQVTNERGGASDPAWGPLF